MSNFTFYQQAARRGDESVFPSLRIGGYDLFPREVFLETGNSVQVVYYGRGNEAGNSLTFRIIRDRGEQAHFGTIMGQINRTRFEAGDIDVGLGFGALQTKVNNAYADQFRRYSDREGYNDLPPAERLDRAVIDTFNDIQGNLPGRSKPRAAADLPSLPQGVTQTPEYVPTGAPSFSTVPVERKTEIN